MLEDGTYEVVTDDAKFNFMVTYKNGRMEGLTTAHYIDNGKLYFQKRMKDGEWIGLGIDYLVKIDKYKYTYIL